MLRYFLLKPLADLLMRIAESYSANGCFTNDGSGILFLQLQMETISYQPGLAFLGAFLDLSPSTPSALTYHQRIINSLNTDAIAIDAPKLKPDNPLRPFRLEAELIWHHINSRWRTFANTLLPPLVVLCWKPDSLTLRDPPPASWHLECSTRPRGDMGIRSL